MAQEEHNTEDHLPHISACFKIFQLPPYPSVEKAKDKLLYAAEEGKTFEEQ